MRAFYLLRTHHMIKEIGERVGLNKTTGQDIKAKINNYGNPLPHKQIGRLLKINKRIERYLKRIIREDSFASFKEINMELVNLNIFVCIETLRSYVDRLDFKSYGASHKSKLAAGHRKSKLRWTKKHINWTKNQWKNVVWSDGSRFCVEGSKRDSIVWWCF